MATEAADFLSSATALFIAIIARSVSSELTRFRVLVRFEPYSLTSFFESTGATCWKPNMFRGSERTTYFVEISCGSVVKMPAASTFPWLRRV